MPGKRRRRPSKLITALPLRAATNAAPTSRPSVLPPSRRRPTQARWQPRVGVEYLQGRTSCPDCGPRGPGSGPNQPVPSDPLRPDYASPPTHRTGLARPTNNQGRQRAHVAGPGMTCRRAWPLMRRQASCSARTVAAAEPDSTKKAWRAHVRAQLDEARDRHPRWPRRRTMNALESWRSSGGRV